jgi:opacity protein-like surface antigen
MSFKPLVAAAALLAAPAVFAQEDNPEGFYVGAGLGQFNVEIDDVSDVTGTVESFDADDDTLKIFGGWRFSPNFAIELDYLDFGGAEDNISGVDVSAEIDGFAPFAILSLPAGPVELFAKAGYLFYDVEFEVDDFDAGDSSDEDLVYGAGLGLTLFDHLHARLEYEIIDISDVDEADALWLSGAWRF